MKPLSVIEQALSIFCDDLGTMLDLDAPSHRRAVENFEHNWKVLRESAAARQRGEEPSEA